MKIGTGSKGDFQSVLFLAPLGLGVKQKKNIFWTEGILSYTPISWFYMRKTITLFDYHIIQHVNNNMLHTIYILLYPNDKLLYPNDIQLYPNDIQLYPNDIQLYTNDIQLYTNYILL